jgi:flagellar hook assembly protein FlgD
MMPDFTPGEANRYVDAVNEIEMNASLKQNYPNPFNEITNIEFTLNEPDHVTITIYTISGSIVSTLVDKDYNKGSYTLQWNASGLVPGFYFYSIRTSTGTDIKKASIIR